MTDREQERLDELQQDIDEVRRDAAEHGTLPSEPERTFADPDADGEVEGTDVPPPFG